ncbi:hypothetical protein E2C01_024835 [Portunus trituberculatus]|uniref:Uncharacterized protein n=1 Tax=Portunus trituberculatus TaxID=210409 RepID=A0A5B7EBS6_PORTR|nr:hypothetical protein [Portunus trituberculatus]
MSFDFATLDITVRQRPNSVPQLPALYKYPTPAYLCNRPSRAVEPLELLTNYTGLSAFHSKLRIGGTINFSQTHDIYQIPHWILR